MIWELEATCKTITTDKMIEYYFSPTGILYQTKQNNLDKLRLKVDQKSNLIQQLEPLPNNLFRPNDGWKRTNEPEEHLDEIAEQISREVHDPRILCFSYKDESLAKRLTAKQDNYEILFDEEYGIIKKVLTMRRSMISRMQLMDNLAITIFLL